MKLIIEIDEESYLKSYLSILTIGMLDCIEKGIITFDDTAQLLFSPGMMETFKAFPNISEYIHLGTELEDVASIIPHKLLDSIDDIREQCHKEIQFNKDHKQHIKYRVNVK